MRATRRRPRRVTFDNPLRPISTRRQPNSSPRPTAKPARTRNEYVAKPQTDEGEAYREALRREARVSPAVAGHLERVEATVAQLLGRETAGPRPAWKQD